MTFKKLSPKESTFYVFEINSSTFSVFDSELDIAIYHGSWNMCAGIIRSIKSNMPKSKIMYYTKEKNESLKLDSQWSYNI